MKNKIVILLICIAVLAGGILYGLPYVRIYQIFSTLQSGDVERLARYVDFSPLRLSINEQVQAAASTPNRTGGMDKVRQAMTMKMMAYAIDQMVTPAGLTAFFMKNLSGFMGDADKPAAGYGTLKIFVTFLGFAHCGYASPAEFVITFQDGPSQPIRFVLNRTGLDWKLKRIVLSRSVFGMPE